MVLYSYEDAISNATVDYSEHAAMGITELEVFTGNIFNKSGVQTRRQQDKSFRLKDEFDRIAKWAEAMMRKREIMTLEDQDEEQQGATDSPNEALILSLACLSVGCVKDEGNSPSGPGRRSGGDFHSFKVVAACCAIREFDLAIKRANIAAGAT